MRGLVRVVLAVGLASTALTAFANPKSKHRPSGSDDDLGPNARTRLSMTTMVGEAFEAGAPFGYGLSADVLVPVALGVGLTGSVGLMAAPTDDFTTLSVPIALGIRYDVLDIVYVTGEIGVLFDQKIGLGGSTPHRSNLVGTGVGLVLGPVDVTGRLLLTDSGAGTHVRYIIGLRIPLMSR